MISLFGITKSVKPGQTVRSTGGLAVLALGSLMTLGAISETLAQTVRTPSAEVPYPSQQQTQQQGQLSAHQLRCLQLEQELANDWTRHQRGGEDPLPKIDAEIRKYDRIYQTNRSKAERSGCYQSMFIFGRSLVRTPRCMRMHNTIEDARRRLADLNQQRSAIANPQSRARRKNELIDALSRAGCGSHYQQQTRRGGGGWFTSLFEEDHTYTRRQLETSRITPYATYRTLCVRTCDGYYFPVSFSTLPSRFSSDNAQCQKQCAAPAELFVYRNPGEAPEQMVSSDGVRPYNDLPNAWRYRKEYVKGCSCKIEEYDPAEIEAANLKAEAERTAAEQGTNPAGAGQVAQEKAPATTRQ